MKSEIVQCFFEKKSKNNLINNLQLKIRRQARTYRKIWRRWTGLFMANGLLRAPSTPNISRTSSINKTIQKKIQSKTMSMTSNYERFWDATSNLQTRQFLWIWCWKNFKRQYQIFVFQFVLKVATTLAHAYGLVTCRPGGADPGSSSTKLQLDRLVVTIHFQRNYQNICSTY